MIAYPFGEVRDRAVSATANYLPLPGGGRLRMTGTEPSARGTEITFRAVEVQGVTHHFRTELLVRLLFGGMCQVQKSFNDEPHETDDCVDILFSTEIPGPIPPMQEFLSQIAARLWEVVGY